MHPSFVWSPHSDRLQPAIAVPELFDLLHSRQLAVLDEDIRSRIAPAAVLGAVLLILPRFEHAPIEWLTVMWFAFFAMPLLELGLTRWQWKKRTEADVPKLGDEALFQQWLAWQKPSVGVKCLMGVLVAFFILSSLAGLGFSVGRYAMDEASVRKGEVLRLLTCFFLHGNLVHLIFNCGAFARLAQFTEAMAGRAWLWICLLAATLGGSVLGFLLPPDVPSIGASGGILGLLGFLLAFVAARERQIPGEFRGQLWRWALYVALLGIVGWQQIDNVGHLGGLLAGGLCGWVANALLRHGAERTSRPWLAGVAIGCIAVFGGVALTMAAPLWRAWQAQRELHAAVERAR